MKKLEIKKPQDILGGLRLVREQKQRFDQDGEQYRGDYEKAVIMFMDLIGSYGQAEGRELEDKLGKGNADDQDYAERFEDLVFDEVVNDSFHKKYAMEERDLALFKHIIATYEAMPFYKKSAYLNQETRSVLATGIVIDQVKELGEGMGKIDNDEVRYLALDEKQQDQDLTNDEAAELAALVAKELPQRIARQRAANVLTQNKNRYRELDAKQTTGTLDDNEAAELKDLIEKKYPEKIAEQEQQTQANSEYFLYQLQGYVELSQKAQLTDADKYNLKNFKKTAEQFEAVLKHADPNVVYARKFQGPFNAIFEDDQRRAKLTELKQVTDAFKKHLEQYQTERWVEFGNYQPNDELELDVAGQQDRKIFEVYRQLTAMSAAITNALAAETIRPKMVSEIERQYDGLIPAIERFTVIHNIAQFYFAAAQQINETRDKYVSLKGKNKYDYLDGKAKSIQQKAADMLKPKDPLAIQSPFFRMNDTIDNAEKFIVNEAKDIVNECRDHKGFYLILNTILSFFKRLRKDYSNVIETKSELAVDSVRQQRHEQNLDDMLQYGYAKENALENQLKPNFAPKPGFERRLKAAPGAA